MTFLDGGDYIRLQRQGLYNAAEIFQDLQLPLVLQD